MRSLLEAAPIRSSRDIVARAGFRVFWLAVGGAIATAVGFLLDRPPTPEGVTFVVGGSALVVLAGILFDTCGLRS